ncbi:MAG: GIY-YIG nuclease family protein [Opitutaceae bacterium]
MHYVYLLRSIDHPNQTYIGLTEDLKKRLRKHNYGEVPHTSEYKPWKLISYTAFQSREQATDFETYLKSGSGRAFAKRRLW